VIASVEQATSIDYQLRREALADLTDIKPEDWHQVCTNSGVRMNHRCEVRRPEATAWIWVRLTGGGFHFAPSLGLSDLTQSERRVADNRYRQYFLGGAAPVVRAALASLAGDVLKDRRLPGPVAITFHRSEADVLSFHGKFYA
jgi:hypothetical protein